MITNKQLKVWSILDLPNLNYKYDDAFAWDKGRFLLSSTPQGVTLYRISYRKESRGFKTVRRAALTPIFDLDYTGDWLAELNKKAADNKVPYTFTLTA